MIVGSAIFWFIVLCLKYNPFVSWLTDLRNESKNKVIVVLSLFYKSPFFWLWLAAVPYKILTKMETFQHAMFYLPLWYICPTGICLIVWHYQLKHTWPGKKPDQIKEHIRGSIVAEEKGLVKALSKCTDDGCLPIIADIKIPGHYETMHFFTIGRPGCGKSQLFYRIIQKVMERGDKAVIYDFKGDQVAKFFDSEEHILFNPFDSRCANWNIFNEIESPLDIRSISNSLIPITGSDPYWSNAARDVFSGILTACYQAGRGTNEEVYKCCNMPAKDLSDFLTRYKGAETATRHLAQDKAAQSILSVMGSSTQCFEYLRNISGDFSIKKWATDDKDRRSVFLTNYSEISDTIRPVLSLFIELAGKRVLSLPDDRQRRFFFFIDEFGTLNNLPTIPVMLTNGRSKGVSVWIAIQDMGQIEKIYGKETSQTILNSCATTFTFAVNDPYTADYLSRKIGDREIRQTNVSESTGTRDSGPSQTVSQQTLNERVVLPSEIMSMPNLTFLLKFPEYNVTPVGLDIVSLPDKSAAYMPRDDIRLKVEASELQGTGTPEKKQEEAEKNEDDEFVI
jgi:type IV secretory pathway TraG/TraD family ATPase VirD4